MGKSTTSIELGFIRLNRRKREPLASQLYQSLRDAILEGQLPKGFRLPSTRGLAADLSVSRTTVINAFDQLTAEGYLSSSVGKGTFVSGQLPEEHQLIRFRTPSTRKSSQKNNHLKSQTIATRPQRKSHPLTLSEYGTRLNDNRVEFVDSCEPIIPFLPGVPALDEFPIDVWSRISRRRWKTVQSNALSYGSALGYAPLRNAIAEYVRAFRGVRCDKEQVFVVAGTQQAVDLISRLVVNPGDKVVMENPGYIKAKTAFKMAGAEIIPIDVDDNGMNVDQVFEHAQHASLVYVTPSHQFPMGVTMSIERRMKLIEWANQTGGLIFEDDYDSEYRYSNRPIPSLQGLGDGEQTIYVGSFSKVVFPSLSMGYVVVPKSMISVVKKSLGLWSRPPSTIDQMILTDFIAEGHFARHLRRMRQVHCLRRSTLVESIDQHLSDHLKVVGCNAGLHVAAHLLKKHKDTAVASKLEQIGIIARPLSKFTTGKKVSASGLALGFASSTPSKIKSTVKKMRFAFE